MDASFLTSETGALALFGLAMAAAAPALAGLLRGGRRNERLGQRLQGGAKGGFAEPSRPSGGASMFSGLLARFGANATAAAKEDDLSAVRFKLMQAGYLNDDAVAFYYAARFIGVVVPQVALLFALPRFDGLPSFAPLFVSVLLALVGLALPSIIVDRRIEKRRRECSDGFPDMMDLLVACVEAGLSLDAAVVRVSEELIGRYPTLSYYLRMISLELRAGRSRQSAWRRFAERVGLEEASGLATMLRQSEEMGTSLGDTMRIFASDMRRRRILIAEEKAMALPAKLTVPLIIFIFPVLLGMLISPAVIRVQTLFEG